MIGRRALLGLAPAALASCARSDGAYFRNTTAPTNASLVHILNGDIDTLDPARSPGSYEFYVAPAVLEGLTQYHPESATPMAALATHYEANADCTEYRFYLRGHPSPKGTLLLSSEDLPDTFVRRHARFMSRECARHAIEKLPPATQRALLAHHRRATTLRR